MHTTLQATTTHTHIYKLPGHSLRRFSKLAFLIRIAFFLFCTNQPSQLHTIMTELRFFFSPTTALITFLFSLILALHLSVFATCVDDTLHQHRRETEKKSTVKTPVYKCLFVSAPSLVFSQRRTVYALKKQTKEKKTRRTCWLTHHLLSRRFR